MSSTSFQNFANLKIALLICCPAHVLYRFTTTPHQKHHFHSQILLEISQTNFQHIFQIMEIVDAEHSSMETSEYGEPRILLMLLTLNLYNVTHSITYSLTHSLIFLYLLLLLLCCIRCFCCFCCFLLLLLLIDALAAFAEFFSFVAFVAFVDFVAFTTFVAF